MLGLPRARAGSEVDPCNTWMRLIQEKLLFGTDEPSTFVYCWPAREKMPETSLAISVKVQLLFAELDTHSPEEQWNISTRTNNRCHQHIEALIQDTPLHGWNSLLEVLSHCTVWFWQGQKPFAPPLWLYSFPFGWRVKSKVKEFYSSRLNRWFMLWALKLRY